MNLRGWVGALLTVSAICDIAHAGQPPTTPADARNVSGLETGDAGQSIKPPPLGISATLRSAPQILGSASAQPSRFTVGSTSVVVGPFFICIVLTDLPSFSPRDDHR